MYIVRLSAAGDSILLSAMFSGTTVICVTPSQCQNTNAGTSGSQIMLDASGNIWIAGSTNTTDLPVTPNALKSTCGCSEFSGDGFLAEFNNIGSALLYATYLGTTPSGPLESDGDDAINSAVMDAGGHIWMAGLTNGTGFPVTSNAIQQQLAGGYDGFLAEYDPSTNKLLYATYFGGTGHDSISNVQVASAPESSILFAGQSGSPALPLPASGFQRGPDFVAALDPATDTIGTLTTFGSGSTGTGLVAASQGGAIVSGTSNIATILESGTPGGASPSLYAVTNSATFVTTGQIVPAELVTLFGAAIGPDTPAAADFASGQAPTRLGGIQVLLDGTPVPLLYAQSDQINAIIPFSPSAIFQPPFAHTITVTNNGASSNAAIVDLTAADPETFSNGAPFAAALNQDGTVNSQSNPAAPGSIVSVFAGGFGTYGGLPPLDGSVITSPLETDSVVFALSDSGPLEVTYAGAAPMLVAGVTQVNFRLPLVSGTSKGQFVFNVSGVFGAIFDIWMQ
jgi:uncharacterized protein (TIGR03437 family)